MDFISAAAELDRLAMIRSYITTDRLDAIRKADPALAEEIEQLCKAIQALRGFALLMEANSVLGFSAAACQPFITPLEAFDEVQRAKGLARLPPEIRPEEVAEYKRLQRYLNSTRAVQRIIAKRQADCSP